MIGIFILLISSCPSPNQHKNRHLYGPPPRFLQIFTFRIYLSLLIASVTPKNYWKNCMASKMPAAHGTIISSVVSSSEGGNNLLLTNVCSPRRVSSSSFMLMMPASYLPTNHSFSAKFNHSSPTIPSLTKVIFMIISVHGSIITPMAPSPSHNLGSLTEPFLL